MVKEKYELWRRKAVRDKDLIKELEEMAGDNELISECFYKDLEFGTGGLRGVIGAGTNRLNIYTVGKATQGIASYINSYSSNKKAVIAYDSRIKSELFAKTAASVFAANGIHVYIFKELEPTPMLSFAVRHFGCDAGVVITASHNPSKYNGYKAYGPDGCQLCLEAAEYVLSIMNKVDIFEDVKTLDFDQALAEQKIEYIDDSVIEKYLDNVESQRVSKGLDLSGLKVIYSPLHGTGNKPVRRILERCGVHELFVVPEQELPDGNFPTAPYPNPEIRQAFEVALRYAEKMHPDILLATDPDCDRVGIAVETEGEYRLLSGNEVGVLLLNYIIQRRTAEKTLPKDPVAVKTIVTTELAEKIADYYNVSIINVLTGFKFIGEQIAKLEEKGEENRFIFGFEESYGYLAGSYVRDKDAVLASMLICEMTAYYKSQGKNLAAVLDDIYKKFGYYLCSQKSFTCEGQSGMERIGGIMESLRADVKDNIGGLRIVSVRDYNTSARLDTLTGKTTDMGLPKSNVIAYDLEDSSSITIRPSGTEPKIKMYLSAVGTTAQEASAKRDMLEKLGTELLGF